MRHLKSLVHKDSPCDPHVQGTTKPNSVISVKLWWLESKWNQRTAKGDYPVRFGLGGRLSIYLARPIYRLIFSWLSFYHLSNPPHLIQTTFHLSSHPVLMKVGSELRAGFVSPCEGLHGWVEH